MLLFNIATDMLRVIIKRVKDGWRINGIVPRLVDDGLSIQ